MDSRIIKVSEAAKKGFQEMAALQKGELMLVKTGDESIDSHLKGMLPSSVTCLGGGSGIGKSEKWYKLLDGMLDVNVNPQAKEFVSLDGSLEVRMLNRLLRKIHGLTGKKKSKILTEEFTEEEKEIVREYNKSLQDNRRFLIQEPVFVTEFVSMMNEFLEVHKDKKAVIISVDQVLNFKDSDKAKAIQILSDAINEAKLKYSNGYYFLLNQLNRGADLTKATDRDNSILPSTSWLFQSSIIEFLADYILILVNPFKAGIDEFMKFNGERYDYLAQHYAGPDKKGKESFSTIGKLFTFVLKTRESDNPYRNVFIEDMQLSGDVLNKMKNEAALRASEKTLIQTPNIPIFDNTTTKVEFDIFPLKEETPF